MQVHRRVPCVVGPAPHEPPPLSPLSLLLPPPPPPFYALPPAMSPPSRPALQQQPFCLPCELFANTLVC